MILGQFSMISANTLMSVIHKFNDKALWIRYYSEAEVHGYCSIWACLQKRLAKKYFSETKQKLFELLFIT